VAVRQNGGATFGLVKMSAGGVFLSWHELRSDATGLTACNVGYDRDRGQLIYGATAAAGARVFGALDLVSETKNFELVSWNGDSVPSLPNYWWLSGPNAAGHLYGVDSNTIYRYDAADGAQLGSWARTLWTPTTSVFGEIIYDPVNHAIVAADAAEEVWRWFFLDRLSGEGGGTTYQALVEQIAGLCGLTPGSDLDASNLIDAAHGRYVLRSSGRAHVEALQTTGFFDVVEDGPQIVFPKRGSASSATIDIEDLGAHPADAGRVPPLVPTRTAERENLPYRVEVTLPDPDLNYEPGVQSAKRNRAAVQTRRVLSIRDDLAGDADTGKQIAERALFLAWLNRSAYTFSVTRKWASLLSADVITIQTPTAAYKMLLIEINDTASGIRECKALAEDVAIYTSNASGAVGGGMPLPTVPPLASSLYYLMDLPLLRDADDGLVLYVAAGSYGVTGWPGVQIFQSDDGGAFTTPFTFVDNEATHGYATDVLADHAPWVWDETSSVNVRIYRGSLASATKAQVYAGANALLIGSEIIGFRTATLEADGSYTLSGMIRGRRGSEGETGNHGIGDRVVLLTPGTVQRKSYSALKLGDPDFYAGVTLGDVLANATKRSLTLTGRSLKPYAPVQIAGSRDGSNNLTITARRRSRVGHQPAAGLAASPPLGELVAAYECDILDGAGAVLRTLAAATLSFSYTAAQQTTDGLTPGDPVDVAVYQISQALGTYNDGRGFPGSATV
jgi:hypothetical protein